MLIGFAGLGGLPLVAQTSGRLPLEESIQNIKKNLGSPQISGVERHSALIRLARLLQFSGDLEGATQAWMDAVFAEPGKRDDTAQLEVARCFIAMGELDKAEANVKVVALNTQDGKTLLDARYLEAQLGGFRSGDTVPLVALINDPDYREYRPRIYYTLWKISGDALYKSRLLSEYASSPEGIITGEELRINGGSIALSASPSALWLLFPGREGVVMESTAVASTAANSAVAALQAGLFGREANAQALVSRLTIAGFQAHISHRMVNGAAYWVVSVPAGSDADQTIAQLKRAGFDAFPITGQ
jgi:hypothetical protein